MCWQALSQNIVSIEVHQFKIGERYRKEMLAVTMALRTVMVMTMMWKAGWLMMEWQNLGA